MPEDAAVEMLDMSQEELEEYVYFNGIDGATGEYLAPKIERAALGARVRQAPARLDKLELDELKARTQTSQPLLGTEAEEPEVLAAAGWGVIFAEEDPQTEAILDALGPLLSRRREEAGGGPHYREYTAGDGWRSGETAHQFLARHGVGPGPAVPGMVPYYLLIVGDPSRIPFEFQQGLDVQYAVGRLHFATLNEYRRYAESAVQAETGQITRAPRVAFFGVRNTGDAATQLSAAHLAQPLADELTARAGEQDLGWQIDSIPADQTLKPRLSRLMGGDDTPALLFTAGHGAIFPPEDIRRETGLGALVTGEWKNLPGRPAPLTPDMVLRADDIGADADVRGLIAFHFACYSLGMPSRDSYAHLGSPSRIPVGPQPLLAPLPQRLLGHPNGGALAVIGHVDRALPSSFYWAEVSGQKRQLAVFRLALWLLMKGHRIGYALEHFDQRYAELSTLVTEALDARNKWKEVEINPESDRELATLWLANNDARSYIIMGDPAVRVAVVAPANRQLGDEERPNVRFRKQTGAARPFAAASVAAAPGVAEGAVARTLTEPETDAEVSLSAEIAPDGHLDPVTISTWAADDVAAPRAPILKARTRITANGDTDTYLPANLTAGDTPYLETHRAVVGQAVAARLAARQHTDQTSETESSDS